MSICPIPEDIHFDRSVKVVSSGLLCSEITVFPFVIKIL